MCAGTPRFSSQRRGAGPSFAQRERGTEGVGKKVRCTRDGVCARRPCHMVNREEATVVMPVRWAVVNCGKIQVEPEEKAELNDKVAASWVV